MLFKFKFKFKEYTVKTELYFLSTGAVTQTGTVLTMTRKGKDDTVKTF